MFRIPKSALRIRIILLARSGVELLSGISSSELYSVIGCFFATLLTQIFYPAIFLFFEFRLHFLSSRAPDRRVRRISFSHWERARARDLQGGTGVYPFPSSRAKRGDLTFVRANAEIPTWLPLLGMTE